MKRKKALLISGKHSARSSDAVFMNALIGRSSGMTVLKTSRTGNPHNAYSALRLHHRFYAKNRLFSNSSIIINSHAYLSVILNQSIRHISKYGKPVVTDSYAFKNAGPTFALINKHYETPVVKQTGSNTRFPFLKTIGLFGNNSFRTSEKLRSVKASMDRYKRVSSPDGISGKKIISGFDYNTTMRKASAAQPRPGDSNLWFPDQVGKQPSKNKKVLPFTSADATQITADFENMKPDTRFTVQSYTSKPIKTVVRSMEKAAMIHQSIQRLHLQIQGQNSVLNKQQVRSQEKLVPRVPVTASADSYHSEKAQQKSMARPASSEIKLAYKTAAPIQNRVNAEVIGQTSTAIEKKSFVSMNKTTPANTTGAVVNVTELAENVYRIIEDKIKIERERRGILR